jgi:hypothetical protein
MNERELNVLCDVREWLSKNPGPRAILRSWATSLESYTEVTANGDFNTAISQLAKKHGFENRSHSMENHAGVYYWSVYLFNPQSSL